MGIEPHHTLESELQGMLRQAGLPPAPREVIGRVYSFRPEDGPHYYLCGTVQAIEISDDGFIELLVSSPRFRNNRLRSIMHINGVWKLCLDITLPERGEKDFDGMSEEEANRLIERDLSSCFLRGELKLL